MLSFGLVVKRNILSYLLRKYDEKLNFFLWKTIFGKITRTIQKNSFLHEVTYTLLPKRTLISKFFLIKSINSRQHRLLFLRQHQKPNEVKFRTLLKGVLNTERANTMS